jgi:Carboxypeptidase regulatory-like domain
MKVRKYLYLAILGFLCSMSLPALWAQTATGQPATGSLRGQVADPSGAAIPGASVVLTPATGSPSVIQSDAQGGYDFKGVPAGKYSLTIAAQGFTLYENDNVVVSNQPMRLNVTMAIEVETQKVQVSDTAPTIDVNPANNAGAIVLSGKELEALPDDPDELQSDLEALAGPSAGPNGGQMYIDGFTAGQLPPKSSIREIRINQNPFSSEYDKLGYGRIEIFTKPGTDKLHGQFFADGNDSVFNAQNPFAGGGEPPYYSTQFNGNTGGPINKNASFFVNIDRRDINELAAINAVDPTTGDLTATAVGNPRQRTNISPRIDWALTKNNTLTARYQYYRDTETNTGVGVLDLESQGYYSKSIENTVQISDTQVFGSKIVNETRFQYLRDTNIQNPNETFSTVMVLGAFTGGGNSEGALNDLQNSYEGQNYTSIIHGNHILKFGGRVRATEESDYSTSLFNGTFIFPSYSAYQANTPTQLSYTTGSPTAGVTYYDIEPYVQDDWKVRPNVTLSYGLRFESQNAIPNRANWAPRLGFAWGVGGRNAAPKVVIRGGSGIFFDRFLIANLLQAERLNGVTQTRFVVTNPTCFPGLNQPFTVPLSSCGTPEATASTTYQISSNLHAPYTLQSAISVERQVTRSATLSLTYLNSRGFDQFITINADAPYPGTPCTNCTPTTNLYRYVSEANFKQNQFIVNTNVRVGSKVQLFGYYTLNYADSDTAGIATFPSNSWNLSQDWGRGAFDIRHRLFLGGTIALPYLLRLSPFMIYSSGIPFNITSQYDLNGDSQYNDRPGFISNATCPASPANTYPVGTGPNQSIYCTPLGTFDARPDLATTPEQIVPINYATGQSHFVMNLRLTKTFGFGTRTKSSVGQGPGGGDGGGRRGGGGPRGPLFGGGPTMISSNSDRRYNLTLGVSLRNAFNNVNVANPSGVLGSKFFDTPNALQGGPYSPSSAANRRLDLLATFNF